MTNSISVAAVVSHPIQYQAPLFRELAQHEKINLTVYFLSDHGVKPSYDEGFGEVVEFDVPLLKGYNHKFIKNYSPFSNPSSFTGMINPGILKELYSEDHDIIWLHGWESFTHMGVIGVGNMIDTPILIRGDSNGLVKDERSGKSILKSILLFFLLHSIDGFASVGSANRAFYKSYGIHHSDIFSTKYSVDNSWFQEKKEEAPSQEQLKQKQGIPSETPVVLAVGKLIPRKQPVHLLRSFIEATEPDDAKLVFVGAGELKQKLQELSIQYNRQSDVLLPGFVDQNELPHYYKMSDLFALVSESEPWGLVVNEAMNFNLPIICTEVAGAQFDLVNEDNGIVISPKQRQELVEAIQELIYDDRKREQMGENSLEKISNWGIEDTAESLATALLATYQWD